MPIQMQGQEIERIRGHFGLSVAQLAAVLGIHPSTVNRWEQAGPGQVPIDGVPASVLLGLRQRIDSSARARAEAQRVGQEVGEALLIGGTLVALAALLSWLVEDGKRGKQ